jgi:GTPase SAR1 family protein
MKQSSSNSQPRVKILILGEGGVGKTSLLSQFIEEEFNLHSCLLLEYNISKRLFKV